MARYEHIVCDVETTQARERAMSTATNNVHIATINAYGVRTAIYTHPTNSQLVLVYRTKNGYTQIVKEEPAAKWAKYSK